MAESTDTGGLRGTKAQQGVLATALARFRLSADAFSSQRQRDLDVQKFMAGDQWTEDAKQQRGGQVVNGMPLPARPMLTIPKLDQPTSLVINQMRNAHLGVLIHPENEEANDDTAEILQGLYRHIEVASRAQMARNWADERAVLGGLGFYRVLTVPAEHSGDEFDQDIVIKRILNQASVYVDPYAQEADFCDMEWGFIGGFIPKERFKREYPKAKFTDSEDFTSLGDQAPAWYTSADTGDAIRVMEYFYVDYTHRERVGYKDETGELQRGYADELGDDFDQTTVKHRMPVTERKVTWLKMTGVEILEEQEWNGKYIPIIPTIGNERNIDGERRWAGMVEPAMDAARLYNYAASDMVEKTALATKAPYVGAEGQFEGHEAKWNQANARNFPYLEYKPTTLAGVLVPPPQRNLGSVDLGPQLAMLQQADDFINSTTFVHEPSKGQQSGNRSGKAVLALQQQADQGNSNYLDNKATITMTYEAKVILDLIPKIYDRPGRVARILGIDDKEQRVILNAPFQMDPQTKRPQPVDVPPSAPGQPPAPLPSGVKQYDLTKGAYSVTVSVGKAWQTRMQQGADELQQILQAAPNLLPIIGDIYFKFRDFPGHTEIAERLKKMAPPPIQAMLNEGQQPDAEQLQGQLQQQTEQMKQMGQQLQQMQQALETEQAKQAAETQRAEMDNQAKVEVARIQAESKLQFEQLRAQIAESIELLKQAHADRDREDTQRHEMAMAAAEAHKAATQAERQHEQAEDSAEQSFTREQALPDEVSE